MCERNYNFILSENTPKLVSSHSNQLTDKLFIEQLTLDENLFEETFARF